MNLKQLRYFCAVVESGTLARAAEQLYVAPTAISMQIGLLEADLGGELFDRAVRPMVLTPLGRFFQPRAKELLANGERLAQDTRDVATGKRGVLSIGFVRSLLYSVFPNAVREFRAKHSQVKLELIELLSEHQPAQLRSGLIQIGLGRHVRVVDPPPDLRHTLLFEDEFLVALSAGSPLARRKSVTLAALEELEFISYPKDPQSTFPPHVLEVLRAAGCRPRVGHEAIEIHTALGLVAAGLGYAVVGASVSEQGRRDVVFVKVPEIRARTTVLAVTRTDEDGALVRSMLDILTKSPVKLQIGRRRS